MTTHLSVRLAWHDSGWDGRICRDPAANFYCVGSHSLLSERLARERDLKQEPSTPEGQPRPAIDAKYPLYLPQDEEPGCTGREARARRGLGPRVFIRSKAARGPTPRLSPPRTSEPPPRLNIRPAATSRRSLQACAFLAITVLLDVKDIPKSDHFDGADHYPTGNAHDLLRIDRHKTLPFHPVGAGICRSSTVCFLGSKEWDRHRHRRHRHRRHQRFQMHR